MHREEQVLQAAKALIEAEDGIAAAVYSHRTLPLNAEDQELPAVVVNKGSDTPPEDDGYTNMGFVDSTAEIQITLHAQGRDQIEVDGELDRLRVCVHKAMLQSPRTLGLSFVMGIRYGGAQQPEYSDEGSPLAGRRVCAFSIDYRMNLTDPE